MKRYIILSIVILPFFISACSGWLDVKPEDEIDEKDLFSSGMGYRHALNGVYFSMATKNLYGKQLSWGVVDALGQCYSYDNAKGGTGPMAHGAAIYEWKQFEFQPLMEEMWKKTYNVVANCNNIIKNIAGENPDKFDYKEGEKKMIWGEALALRAFLQFDMLRLFAAAPSTNPNDRKFIPYIKDYPVYVSRPLSVDSCLDNIIRDLKEAKALLWKADSGKSFSNLNFWEYSPSDQGLFYTNKRAFRLNYYATSAMLARVYLYAQKEKEAYNEAKAIIDFSKKNRYFTFKDNSYYGDMKFYNDILWGLEVVDLLKFEVEVNAIEPADDLPYLDVLELKNNFFPTDVTTKTENGKEIEQSNDVRFKYWVTKMSSYYGTSYKFIKYTDRKMITTPAKLSSTLLPMIRMSEMYYIAAEVIYKENLSEAKDYLQTVKKGRGLYSSDGSMQELSTANTSNFMNVLINDARRDLIGEGQIFYMYKRLNKNIPAKKDVEIKAEEKKFVLPLPESETSIK